MSIKKRLFAGLSVAILVLSLISCHDNKPDAQANIIKVGTIAGPETQLMEAAKEVARNEYDLDVEIVTFTDYNQPNEALNDGSIDANIFQHLPYLQQAIAAHDYKIMSVGKTFIYPMGIYSKRYENLAQIPRGAIVAIPNDPSNEARALLLLQQAKLIKLKAGGNATSTPMDIVENRYRLQVKSFDAAQLPRILPDVAIAVINANYAVPAGLYPNRDALFAEGKDSPYANLIVARTDEQYNQNVLHLVAALHSPQVLETAQKLFNGQAVPAW